MANGCRAIAGIAGRRGTSLLWRPLDEEGFDPGVFFVYCSILGET